MTLLIDDASGFTLEWWLTFGNLLTTLLSVFAIVGAAYGLIRYLRGNITEAIVQVTEKIDRISDRITYHEQNSEDSLKNTLTRVEEIKWMMQGINKRVDEVKDDMSKRVDERNDDIKHMNRQLGILKEELYTLRLDVVRKIESSHAISGETRKHVWSAFDDAEVQQKKAMDTVRRRMTEEEARGIRQLELEEQEILALKRKAMETLRQTELTRLRHQTEDRIEREVERADYKEEDRLTRVDEMKDERDIRHTDERRRELYEGDMGKVHRTRLEEKEDPESTHEEKKVAEEEEKKEKQEGEQEGGEKK